MYHESYLTKEKVRQSIFKYNKSYYNADDYIHIIPSGIIYNLKELLLLNKTTIKNKEISEVFLKLLKLTLYL